MLLISGVTSGLLFKPRVAWISKVKPVFSWKIIFTPFSFLPTFSFYLLWWRSSDDPSHVGAQYYYWRDLFSCLILKHMTQSFVQIPLCKKGCHCSWLLLFWVAKTLKIITFWCLMVNNSMRHVWKGIKWAFLASCRFPFPFFKGKCMYLRKNFTFLQRKQKVFLFSIIAYDEESKTIYIRQGHFMYLLLWGWINLEPV